MVMILNVIFTCLELIALAILGVLIFQKVHQRSHQRGPAPQKKQTPAELWCDNLAVNHALSEVDDQLYSRTRRFSLALILTLLSYGAWLSFLTLIIDSITSYGLLIWPLLLIITTLFLGITGRKLFETKAAALKRLLSQDSEAAAKIKLTGQSLPAMLQKDQQVVRTLNAFVAIIVLQSLATLILAIINNNQF